MNFKGTHIVSVRDLCREDIEHILDLADGMIPIARGEKSSSLMKGKIMATLFFEPSTRTRLSFESAMLRLGGRFLGFAEPGGTSVKKGETLADTIRMASAYSDVIVIRHPQEGSARLASKFSDVPVINAGDGAGQHPTQTLLDLMTIRRETGKIDGRKIALVGDLKFGRTVHSLTYALAKFDTDLTFVAPPSLQMPPEVVELAGQMGARTQLANTLEEVVEEADVIYVTRIQKERFPDEASYKKVANVFKIDLDALENAKKNAIVMHPLPRVKEIDPEVDDTKFAAYFKQAFYGVPTRMALLGLVTGVLE
ncbi:MAG: aspartate carbamoyltransferase [Candidatus Thermoplasmatota archaeon]|nr:aspartate carbamoyltransferase [Euryarchaeota archaeon]MBU4032119.1 aspartate carbamoyltransferase [Candidatus Thermoplasmatota archaeon]MBU4070645.1 aspartate carbamoyltransferase [Candidatus Thermoplasmatota archaeon]MBU4145140.1 aspartate carbamoyltransferase [Candidatus Thermoplasmatota archaeon]MBU4591590.1 aspartate carbamoyltransferase [Candidatus Thermoplasmatota archaeon]